MYFLILNCNTFACLMGNFCNFILSIMYIGVSFERENLREGELDLSMGNALKWKGKSTNTDGSTSPVRSHENRSVQITWERVGKKKKVQSISISSCTLPSPLDFLLVLFDFLRQMGIGFPFSFSSFLFTLNLNFRKWIYQLF